MLLSDLPLTCDFLGIQVCVRFFPAEIVHVRRSLRRHGGASTLQRQWNPWQFQCFWHRPGWSLEQVLYFKGAFRHIKVDQQQASWAFACLWCCDCFKACLPAEKLPRWARTSLRWETHVAVKKLRRFFLVCSVFYLYCLLASKGNCPFFTFVHQNKPKFLKRVHFPGVCQWVSSKISGSLASSLVMIPATASLGNLLSLLVTFSFEGALGDGAMTQWGWRLPFLLALLPGSLAIWGRRRLGETAMFLASEAEEQLETGKAKRAMIKIRELVASYWPQVQAQKIDGWVGLKVRIFFVILVGLKASLRFWAAGGSERESCNADPHFKRDPSLLVQIALNSHVYQSNPLGLAGVDWFWGSSCAGCQSLWRDDLGLGLAEETRLVHRLSDSRWSHQQLCGIASGTKDSQKQTLCLKIRNLTVIKMLWNQ